MKPIENEKLEDLYVIATNQLIEERREHAITEITELLRKNANLSLEVSNTEKKLANQKTELDKLNSRLDLLRKGDWNVIKELEVKSDKKENKEGNKE